MGEEEDKSCHSAALRSKALIGSTYHYW